MGRVLFVRRKGSHDLRKVGAQPFQEARTEEDLHRFLEVDPSLIARGITRGEPVPTAVLASHLSLDSGELDLLLLDAEGEITIAELKRGRTPRDVVGQVLDYAAQVVALGVHGLAERRVDWDRAIEQLGQAGEVAEELSLDRARLGLQRPRLLIVAYKIDEVTQRIAEFLRDMGVPIYCIEFEYFVDEEYEYYYPQVIGADEVRKIEERELTPTQRAYRELWEDLLARFKAQKPGVTRRTGTKDSWIQLPIGLAYAHLEWSVHGLNRRDGWFEVGLHLEHHERTKNINGLDWLTERQDQLQSAIGERLHFEEWGRRWARMYARCEAPQINEPVRNWAVEIMVRFYDALDQVDVVNGLREIGW